MIKLVKQTLDLFVSEILFQKNRFIEVYKNIVQYLSIVLTWENVVHIQHHHMEKLIIV